MLKFILIAIVLCSVIAGALHVMKQKKAKSTIAASPKLKEIEDAIFANGNHPKRIAITYSSEIFFGPIGTVGTEYQQIPADIIPPMDNAAREALGDLLAKKYGYSFHLCNTGNKSGYGAQPADTGNNYIDMNCYVLLISTGSNAQW